MKNPHTGWIITVLALLLALVSLPFLPAQIPLQWADDAAVSHGNRLMIFLYPALCAAFCYLLPNALRESLKNYLPDRKALAPIIANALCVLMLVIELLTVITQLG